jgi:hypothetical protein
MLRLLVGFTTGLLLAAAVYVTRPPEAPSDCPDPFKEVVLNHTPWIEWDVVEDMYILRELKNTRRNSLLCVGIREARGLRQANCFQIIRPLYNDEREQVGYKVGVYPLTIKDGLVSGKKTPSSPSS